MAILGISAMSEEVWGRLKDERIPVGVAVGVIAFAFYAYGWATDNFVTTAKAATEMSKLSGQVGQIQQSVDDHIKEYRIGEAIKDVEDLEARLYHVQLHEDSAGASATTRARTKELQERLRKAQIYRDCLLNDRPNCQHLHVQ